MPIFKFSILGGTILTIECPQAGLRQTFTMYPNFRQNAFNDDTLVSLLLLPLILVMRSTHVGL